jgi:drug/metabolite transporter (DMT)-like permease
LIALPLLAVWAWSGRRTPTRGQVGWLALAGLLFGFEISLWAEALFHTTVANATLLSNMTPIFAAGFAWFAFKERVRSGVYWGGAIALLGAVTLAVARARAGAGPAATPEEGWYGDGLGFSSALGYAGYLLIVRHMGGRVITGMVMLIATGAAALYALVLCLVIREPLLPGTLYGWLILIGLGVVVQAGAQGLIAFGVARLPIAASTIMLWMQPVTAGVWSWALFGESLGPLALGGAALVLAGVFLVQRAR